MCIDIDIECGGVKIICICDNGCGIKKDELVLVLVCYVISKIVFLDDFEVIISLGFCGEVLVSISLVFCLMFILCIVEQQEVWQVYVEGCDMDVMVKLVVYLVGMMLEVLDLFYNILVWCKFLCIEKIEFNYIDEIICCIVLVCFDVMINLLYNGKIVCQYCVVLEGG